MSEIPSPAGWLPESRLPELTKDPLWQDWLLERGSMTVRLQGRYPDVLVELQLQGQAVPWGDEARALGLPPGEAAWLRQVRLCSEGRVLLQARTVVPGWAPGNAWHELQGLGTRPLGDLLFRMPDIGRSAFEVAWLARWTEPGDGVTDPGRAEGARLARRCLYTRRGCPLLLTERLLLPGLDCPAG